jgi:transposase
MYEAPSPSGVHSFPERHRRQSGQKKTVHVIVDNYAAHKHPKVLERLARHPRFVFHFIPTSASWLNAAEGLFATLTKRRLKRGVFRSIQELKHAIHSFIADTNAKPNPSFGQKTQTRSLPPPSGGTKC